MNSNQTKNSSIERVKIGEENYFKINHSDLMRPFFMSIVSDSDHWMFISSNGGLTAGRKNAQFALFPYYTDDKITELAHITGPKTIIRCTLDDSTYNWEPFSQCRDKDFHISRNLYKSEYGNKLIFEEVNHSLNLVFSYEWCSSDSFGFVRHAHLKNSSDSKLSINIIDGLQNILPYGVPSDLQNAASNLVDAYKRTELHEDSGLAIYALSAIIVDRAEPSEALKANTVWSFGLEPETRLISSKQLAAFKEGKNPNTETDIKAEKGAYFIQSTFDLNAGDHKDWYMVANVNQNHAAVAKSIDDILNNKTLAEAVLKDIDKGTENLIHLNASADGLQFTNDKFRDARHFANVLFNIMRGGIFDDAYTIEKQDFRKYLSNANKKLADDTSHILQALPDTFDYNTLIDKAAHTGNQDFFRLSVEYLPLKFSRRHGDPSRPWNKFSINTRDENDGSKILDYEGNWRDIFQNWEALSYAYPEFIDGMIFKFLNASTFDGYNPYRVTKGGFDWEIIEEDDPWSYIGYWGDHQIIYLQKFLECIEKFKPGKLSEYFDANCFVYANVPYRIKAYKDILKNPKSTIDFDFTADHNIREDRAQQGADGALLKSPSGDLYRVSFIEKILATTLAKVSNFIPDGGIWMNTQRPEWNDANNALVGNGISMVTLYYMNRFAQFFSAQLDNMPSADFAVSEELFQFYKEIENTLSSQRTALQSSVSGKTRKSIMDALGNAASEFRNKIYENGFSNKKATINSASLSSFFKTISECFETSIKNNRRTDGLYHAYNLISYSDAEAHVSYLSEMLEGQVAVLSSGSLKPEEVVEVLDAMKSSALFREDQYSYILYPNKKLPGFLSKNIISGQQYDRSDLLKKLVHDGDVSIVEKDVNGVIHFNGKLRNADDLKTALSSLKQSAYTSMLDDETQVVLDIFEEVFNHKEFTGRSGTFYGYEGLGSIYWHMVSKLLLAVQECFYDAVHKGASDQILGRLIDHYYEINAGIGVHKPPQLYGAFPTDPYSHTPGGKGAQQPGMTGQVKEDVLSRMGELGIMISEGTLSFNPCLLRKLEFLEEPMSFEYINIDNQRDSLSLPKDALAFTYCQVPIVYIKSDSSSVELHTRDGHTHRSEGLNVSKELSSEIFRRTGHVKHIKVFIEQSILK